MGDQSEAISTKEDRAIRSGVVILSQNSIKSIVHDMSAHSQPEMTNGNCFLPIIFYLETLFL